MLQSFAHSSKAALCLGPVARTNFVSRQPYVALALLSVKYVGRFTFRNKPLQEPLTTLGRRFFSVSCSSLYHEGLKRQRLRDLCVISFRICKQRSGQVKRDGTSNPCYSTTPFNVNRNVDRDTLIFSHKKDNFFKILSIFGAVQLLLWAYLSLFSVQELRSGPVIKKDTKDLPWWQKVLYTEGRYKNAISLLCFTLGASIFLITSTYPRRAVKKLWLMRGGKDAKITTYSWFGQTHTFKTPVEHINCLQSRTGSGSQVPLKIKDRYFFFLLDKEGCFHNPELFDFVIGLQRNLN